MERPSTIDESFKKFLDDLQKQNNRTFATQLLTLKYEKENSNDDNDRREEQLNELISSFQKLEKAVTGFSVKFDVQPIVDSLENSNKILLKQLEELSLTRKLTEGSVEYDKGMAQYRNTSGRDVENLVSGKVSKTGQVIDFETASDRLTGQGKRVRESEANQLKLTPIEMTAGKAATAVTGTPTKGVEPKRLSEYEVKKDDRTWSEFGKDVASEGKTLGGLGGATTGAIIGGVFGGPLGALAGGAIGGVAGKYLGGKATEKYKDYSVEKERYGTAFEKAGKGTAEEGQADYEKRIKEEKEADEAKMFGFESKKPELKPTPAEANPESDNIESPAEIQNKMVKEDLELTKESKTIFEQQLFELRAIREALGGAKPSGKGESGAKPQAAVAEKEKEEDSGPGLLDMLPGKGTLGKIGKGAASLGSKAVKFLSGKGGAVLGGALAVGAGAYTAYQGYTAAEDSKQAKMEDIQAKLDSGEIDEKQASELRKEAGNTATVEKSEAVGEGTGMAAGGIAGMKAGAMIGTAFGGPLGTVVGGALGGAAGMFLGSKAGKAIGGVVGKGIAGVKNFFGIGEEPGAKAKDAVSGSSSEMEATFSEETFAKNDPENYKKFTEYRDKKEQEIFENDPFAKKDSSPQAQSAAKNIARIKAKADAIKKFKKEIEAAGAGGAQVEEKKKEKIESKVEGGPGSKAGPAPVDKSNSSESKTQIAGEDVIPGQPLSEKQMAVIGMSKSMGNKYSPEVEAQYAKQKSGIEVAKTSSENQAMRDQAATSQPSSTTVVNNVSGGKTAPNFIPMKASPRPESSLTRYQDRVAAY